MASGLEPPTHRAPILAIGLTEPLLEVSLFAEDCYVPNHDSGDAGEEGQRQYVGQTNPNPNWTSPLPVYIGFREYWKTPSWSRVPLGLAGEESSP